MLRQEIADSWRRSRLFGVTPHLDTSAISVVDVDARSRLMSAARPVLDQLTGHLGGTRFCVLLADRDCRLVYRWFGDHHIRRQIEDVGAFQGSGFGEGTVGTNALGTPYESGRAVRIHGDEHYAEALKRFSCYGHPIRHPLTGRVEGVLDISGVSSDGNPLFGPLVSRAVQDIEQLIVEGARASERRLFLAFQEATRHRSVPVAVLGGDVVFANKICTDQLSPADPAILRMLLPQLPERGEFRTVIDVGEGVTVSVTAERVPGAPSGAVFHVARTERDTRTGGGTGRKDEPWRSAVITGEPGSGRSSRARASAGAGEVVVLDAASALRADAPQWAGEFARLVERAGTTVVLDDLHCFPPQLLTTVANALDHGVSARMVITTCPADQASAEVTAVVARCEQTVSLKPLRERLDELPALAATMLDVEQPGRRPRFTGAALAALRAHPWPGNLHELRAVLRDVARLPCTGVIDLKHLPPGYRSSGRTRRLGSRDLAERNAIVQALRSHGGNKLRAARALGVSRTTLYRRMRTLEVTEDCPDM
ncbi:sigma-54-dependent Fis family transcriptional regulator [Amycolatopsis ultiminotia]|uniref:sigma-54-dependent Fis family transcriptional regulator n=1 Tax=Amycolatopsis ultiminotia TaxID=543629 RepID=UPI0031EEB928